MFCGYRVGKPRVAAHADKPKQRRRYQPDGAVGNDVVDRAARQHDGRNAEQSTAQGELPEPTPATVTKQKERRYAQGDRDEVGIHQHDRRDDQLFADSVSHHDRDREAERNDGGGK